MAIRCRRIVQLVIARLNVALAPHATLSLILFFQNRPSFIVPIGPLALFFGVISFLFISWFAKSLD
jgi:hypothetical protein